MYHFRNNAIRHTERILRSGHETSRKKRGIIRTPVFLRIFGWINGYLSVSEENIRLCSAAKHAKQTGRRKLHNTLRHESITHRQNRHDFNIDLGLGIYYKIPDNVFLEQVVSQLRNIHF